MTTPERLRRRQMHEGVVLVLLGVFAVGFAIYDSAQDQKDDDCVRQSFADLTAALNRGRDLAAQERELDVREDIIDRREQGADRALITAALSGKYTEPGSFDPIQQAYIGALADVREDRKMVREDREALEVDRKKNPIPPFPEGSCE